MADHSTPNPNVCRVWDPGNTKSSLWSPSLLGLLLGNDGRNCCLQATALKLGYLVCLLRVYENIYSCMCALVNCSCSGISSHVNLPTPLLKPGIHTVNISLEDFDPILILMHQTQHINDCFSFLWSLGQLDHNRLVLHLFYWCTKL